MSRRSNRRIGRIAIAVVLGGVLGAFSTTHAASAADETPSVAATEAPIVGPPSERLSPTDVAAGSPPVVRLSAPVPPDVLRGACIAPGSGCAGRLITPPPPPPTRGVDRVLPAPPVILP